MKHAFYTTALFVMAIFVLQGCDRDGTTDAIDTDPIDPVDLLIATRVTTPPTIDGVADDAAWDGAETVMVSTTVADIPAFKGYGGRRYQVEMKAVYDDNFVYFQAHYNDSGLDTNREPWYVNPETGEWEHESRWPQFDDDGNQTRMGFYEDKFSLMWEATHVEGFDVSGCGVSCHTGLSPHANDAGKDALKYTNNNGEVLDMWHLKYVRSAGQSIPTMDDQHTNWTSTAGNGGRHSDPGVNSYASNKATVDGKTVPKYVLKNPTGSYFWFTPDEIANGDALEVVGVAANGDLTLSDGSKVEASDPDYQRDGVFMPPSVYTRIPDGDRADITSGAVYGGGFWTVEIKRALVTGSDVDVQFDDLTVDFPFGVGVFDNAGIAHATTTQPFFLRFE